MKKIFWGGFFALFIFGSVLLFCKLCGCSKKVDPYDKFEKEAEISGSWSMIENYHANVIKNDNMIGFALYRLKHGIGDQEKLKKEIEGYQDDNIDLNKMINELQSDIKKDSIIYKSMIKK